MAAHNPNHNDAYTIKGTGTLEGISWGTYSSWNLPEAIATIFGTAVRSGNQYLTSAMVVVGKGYCYHSQTCRHALDAVARGRAMLVSLEVARMAGYRPCSKCTPHQTITVATIERTVDQPKPSSPYNRRLLELADHNSAS